MDESRLATGSYVIRDAEGSALYEVLGYDGAFVIVRRLGKVHGERCDRIQLRRVPE
jgi:hypothetical protein